WMKPGNTFEEEFVARHRKINSRRSQYRLAQESERGNSDPDRNQSGASFTECNSHYFRSRSRRRRQTIHAEHSHANEVHGQIKNHDSYDSDDQGSRQVLARFADLARDEARRLPASVGEQHRYKRGSKSGDRGPLIQDDWLALTGR